MTRHVNGQDVRIARERADLARERFNRRLRAMKDRVSPARLKGDAGEAFLDRVNGAKAAARQAVWRRPVLTGSIVLGTATVLFWKPLKRLAYKTIDISREVRDWHQRQQEAAKNDE